MNLEVSQVRFYSLLLEKELVSLGHKKEVISETLRVMLDGVGGHFAQLAVLATLLQPL